MTSRCTEPLVAGGARDYVLGVLAEGGRIGFEDHLAGCPSCAATVTEEGLGRLERIVAQEAVARRVRPWEFLAGTILRPVPALVYLVALLLSYPAYRVLAPSAEPAPAARTIPAVDLIGEIPFRGGPEDPAGQIAEPVVIEAPRDPDAAVLLRVHTDLDEEDLADPGVRLEARLLDGSSVVWSESKRVSDLSGDGVLSLLVLPAKLPGDRPIALVIQLDRPGDPRHGENVFRRSLRIRPFGPPTSSPLR